MIRYFVLICAFWRLFVLNSSAANFTVNMLSGPNRFSPALLTVNVGDTVTWINQSFTGHDTVSGTNLVPSGYWDSNDVFPPPNLMQHGDTYSVTFTNAAGYGYYCTPHYSVGMVGVITVLAPNTPPSVSITNPANGRVFAEGTNILIQATATDQNGSVIRVDF